MTLAESRDFYNNLKTNQQMATESSKPRTENRLFHLVTFGCKVNQVDSAGLVQELAAQGWAPAPPGVAPGLILVNTCTVTARADREARQTIRRLARAHPGAALWVTGCYAQRAAPEVAALQGVQAVLGNQEKARLGEMLSGCQPLPASPAGWVAPFSAAPPFQGWQIRSFPGHTRAWLKIQEGCSHACTYCIVPQVRGPRRSLAPDLVQAALQALGEQGYREVVLTGVDLGQYGRDLPPLNLASLVHRLRGLPLPFRVRLSSLEPMEVSGELLSVLAAWPQFCPHFHLPLQSGSDPVLAAMGRPYRSEDFRALVQEIHRLFPEAGLGLDVLVGFPGESAADFQATYDLVAALPATYLHVFPFSPRPGTPAAQLRGLPAREIRERARLLRDLARLKKEQFRRAQLGQVRQVLVEGPAPRPGWLTGLSDNYLRVILPGAPEQRNRLLKVRFSGVAGEVMVGEVVAAGDD
jgi:threonylcarbamoyladenosine tRNA methylthiotransferase MtaB